MAEGKPRRKKKRDGKPSADPAPPPSDPAPEVIHRTGGPYVDPSVAKKEEPGAGGNGEPHDEKVPLDEHGQPAAEPDRLADPVAIEQPPRLPFVVVGVGASAGGVEAFTEFLQATPPDTGIAYILIIHLPPDRDSMMADVLSHRTKMPVLQVEDGMEVQPNHIYVIRPGRTLLLEDGKLRLTKPLEERGHNRPVDDFFRSLAAEQRERAVCVVLSGMGSNGSVGAQAIKAVGGVCIAQEPDSALFPAMPRHLIESGNADYILRPRDVSAALVRFAGHPYAAQPEAAAAALHREQQNFADVLAILRTRTRQDFSGYKRPTIFRRVQRRMGLNQITKLGDYVRLLRNNAAEVQALADDLLIHVTGFFRDPQAWETLRKQVVEPMITGREVENSIRCWVTACSTGEEAYSLAILIAEALEKQNKPLDVKIFATDMAERSLGVARAGAFPLGIEGEVTPERLERFFDREDSLYRIKKHIRDMVVFAPQNVLQDPPFSKLDICTCRNLLIYLEPELQRRVLSLIHFGLREGGALFLGPSETVGGSEELFESIDRKWRIYRRIGPVRHGELDFPLPRILVTTPAAIRDRGPADLARGAQRPSVAHLTERALLQRYTPGAVVIDREHRIVFFHGPTDKFLTNPAGEPTRELLVLCRDTVRSAVRAALAQAAEGNGHGHARDGNVMTEQGLRRVWVTVGPLEVRPSGGTSAFNLVTFEEHEEASPAPLPHGFIGAPEEIVRLTDELARVRDELQSTIEELQSSNEELKASNEEITSVNEELQSSNEELETSKEELQSLNEELTTVNAQLQAKNDELQATSSDLSSLLASTDIAVIFLDPRLRIRRFTPAVRDLMEVIASDMGRPLANLHRKFDDPNLDADVRSVLERLVPIEREVAAANGREYLRRVLPYRTLDDRIDGVVITFFDVTDRKRIERELGAAKEYAESIVATLHEPLLVLNPELVVQSANEAFYKQFRVTAGQTVGRKVYALGNGQWDIPALRRALEEVLPANKVFDDYQVIHEFEGLGRRVMLLNGRRLDHVQLILLGIRDTTAQHRAEVALRESEERLRRMINVAGVGVLTFDASGTLADANDAFLEMSGYTRQQIASRQLTWRKLTPPEHLRVSEQQLAVMNQTGKIGPYEKEYFRSDGTRRWMLFAGAGMGDGTIVEYCIDTTDAKLAEQARRDAQSRLSAIANLVPDLLWESEPDGSTSWYNQRWLDYTGQSLEQAKGWGWAQAIHPDERENSVATYRRGVERGHDIRQEHRIRGRDGAYRWFLMQAKPLRDAAGRIIHWFGAATDIHEQRMALNALREGDKQFRLVFEGARDFAMVMLDPDNTIRAWNAGAERITGFSKDEAIGQSGEMLFVPEDRAAGAPQQELSEAAAKGSAADERWHQRKDGTRFWGSGVMTALRNPGGSLRAFVKVLRDETPRKEAEEALQAAKSAAELANRMKDDFLATLSHELRTPLASILIWAKLLRRQAADRPDYVEALDAITRSADAQKQLIDDLLDTSRITSGKLRLEMRLTELAPLVKQSAESVLPTAEAKGVTINSELSPDVGVVWVDPDRLRQVVWNLLNNAVKFTPAGGRVDVGLLRRGREVEIRVADSGMGIDPEFLPHIFQPFRQAESSTTRAFGGLGLGLAICKQLVEQHGGTISAQSAGPEKGSTFIVRIPLPSVRPGRRPGRETGSASAAPSGNGGATPLRGARILLVEDEPETRTALLATLRQAGAEVTAVDTAAAAIEVFKKSRPDLLVSDIGMPGQDGYELIRQVRALESTAGDKDKQPVLAVALTAFAREEDRDRALAAGFDRHIGKPVEPDPLIAALRDLLATRE